MSFFKDYGCSYLLQKAINCAELKFNEFDFEFSVEPNRLAGFVYTGCKYTIKNTPYALSMQTHPMIAGPSMCEIAIIKDDELMKEDECIDSFEMDDQVERFYREEDLVEFLDKFCKNVQNTI